MRLTHLWPTTSAAVERRLLQAAVFIAAWVPIAAGLAGALDGARMIAGVDVSNADLQSHFRYLSGLLLGIGVAFMAIIPTIERRSALFLALSGIVVTGGVSRLAFALIHGGTTMPHQLALIMELLIVPMLLLWQRRIAGMHSRQAWRKPA